MNIFTTTENMIMYAFRYSLGRRTGAVSEVVDYIKENWHKLEPFTQDQMKHEIEDAIRMDNAGDQCDIDQWRSILELEPTVYE
jgi:hypothetical protein